MTTQDIFNAVLAFDEETLVAKTQAELDGRTDIGGILNDGLISAMDWERSLPPIPKMMDTRMSMPAALALAMPFSACSGVRPFFIRLRVKGSPDSNPV